MGDEFSLEDVLIILQRRFWYFLIPVLVIAPLGILTVMLLPPKYTAKGTILVESQQIPTEFIRSTINAYAQERIQTIRQRVMTRNRLLQVADKYTVFPRTTRLSESERVDLMRSGLNVSLITIDRGRRSAKDGTIAFTISYTDRDPAKAYLVANEFMTLFLSEDVSTRTAGASNTTEFFEREAAKLRTEVSAIESRISNFKVENADALPEHLNMHLDMLERTTRELNSSQRSIEALEEEKRFLETQLTSNVGSENGLSQELLRLEGELARLRGTYLDTYPEIQAKRSEIAAIKRQMAPSAEIQRLRAALRDAEAALFATERTETASAEDITAAEIVVESARDALSEKISRETRNGATDISGVQMEGRLAIIENRIRMLDRSSDGLRAQIKDYEARIGRTPAVERDIAGLTRDYENTFQEYQDVRGKQQDAQLAENLEENRQAEKFSILEPALRPDRPTSPDRIKLSILAIFAALAAGGGIGLAAEILFSTIRGRNHVAGLVDEHPIAVIPYIPGDKDKKPSLLSLFGRRKIDVDNMPEAA
jgi:protein tyrosine kinase modulator